jgi:hypothetical protein
MAFKTVEAILFSYYSTLLLSKIMCEGVFRLTDFYFCDECIGLFVHSSRKYSSLSLATWHIIHSLSKLALSYAT